MTKMQNSFIPLDLLWPILRISKPFLSNQARFSRSFTCIWIGERKNWHLTLAENHFKMFSHEKRSSHNHHPYNKRTHHVILINTEWSTDSTVAVGIITVYIDENMVPKNLPADTLFTLQLLAMVEGEVNISLHTLRGRWPRYYLSILVN